MLNDIGISRVDAEYHAGRFRRDEHLEDIYYNRNEKSPKIACPDCYVHEIESVTKLLSFVRL